MASIVIVAFDITLQTISGDSVKLFHLTASHPRVSLSKDRWHRWSPPAAVASPMTTLVEAALLFSLNFLDLDMIPLRGRVLAVVPPSVAP